MKHNQAILFFSVLLWSCFAMAQEPTDCINALIICGDSDINLDVDGFGIQEIGSNACFSEEHKSLWMELNISASGTLGFVLTPESTDIIEDYDFWLFGPDVTCDNLGNAIRCSTTNPAAANQGNNLTGMNETSTDVSEGIGADGDSFVQWINVVAGERYYLILDRPHGSSAFNLTWTGTAEIGEAPENQANQDDLDETICSTAGTTHTINLDNRTPLILGSQTDANISYHNSENDAILDINPITTNPTVTTPSQTTFFFRLTNPITGCFSVFSFDVSVFKFPQANDVFVEQCDEDGTQDGLTVFDINSIAENVSSEDNTTVMFYTSEANQTNNNPITEIEFFNTENPQELIAVATHNETGCESTATVTLQGNITNLDDYQVPPVCDELDSEDGINTFNLNEITDDITNGLPTDITVSYHNTLDDALLFENALASPYENTTPYGQTIYARAESPNGCYGIAEIEFTITPLPTLADDDTVFYCLNTHPQSITLNAGVVGGNPNTYTYNWSTGETTADIFVNETGVYTVTVTNGFDCSTLRSITVEPSNTATIEQIEIIDGQGNHSMTVLVSGEGEYLYSIESEDGTVFPYQESHVFTNLPAGIYTVYVMDVKNDCGVVTEVVSVVGFPNFFTPNGDGYNDTWQVWGLSEIFQSQSDIFIFDRYGKLLKQLDPLGYGWDGNHNGHPMPADDYWFVVKLEDGREFKGHFALKR